MDVLAEYKKQRDIALGGIGIAGISGCVIGIVFESVWADTVWQACGTGAMFLFFVVYYYYAKAKGYHGAWGWLGFLGPLGWLILMWFPDRHKLTKVKREDEQDKE